MACSKAEDLINQLIEATLKLLDFGLNIMDALRVQKLLTIRNQKIGLISDDACLPECSLRFSLNFDLMMFNKLLRNACLRARATLNELRVCRLRYPNAPLVLEPKTKVKFHKLQKKIQEFDEAVRSDKMIARRDLRDFREISIIFSQLEHDLKLLICSLECASTMKDTVLFAAPITDVMTVLSIVLNRLEHLAQKAEIDEKIAAAEQQKALQDQKTTPSAQSNSATPYRRQQSTPSIIKNRTNDVLLNGKNTNRTSKQRRQDMTAMIAAASQQIITSTDEKNIEHRQEKKSIQSDTPQMTRSNQSNKSLKESNSIEINDNKHCSKLPRHISRHYTSMKSNVLRHPKKVDLPIEISSNHHQPINRRQMKQFRNEFIRKWADDARNTCAQNHIIQSSNTYSDEMTNGYLEKKNHQRQKSTHRRHRRRRRSFSSSSLLNNSNTSSSSSSSSSLNELYNNKTKIQSSNSTILSSKVENQSNIKHKNPSSNNSAIVCLKSKKSNDNIDCKIS